MPVASPEAVLLSPRSLSPRLGPCTAAHGDLSQAADIVRLLFSCYKALGSPAARCFEAQPFRPCVRPWPSVLAGSELGDALRHQPGQDFGGVAFKSSQLASLELIII